LVETVDEMTGKQQTASWIWLEQEKQNDFVAFRLVFDLILEFQKTNAKRCHQLPLGVFNDKRPIIIVASWWRALTRSRFFALSSHMSKSYGLL